LICLAEEELNVGFDRFREECSRAIRELRSGGYEEALVVHHNDADGLCSGALVKAALEREGVKPRLICLEKVYPEVISSIHSTWSGVVFYCDIGSSHAGMISEYNRGRCLTIILDHHDPEEAWDERVVDLNLERFGYVGETDFSGATCCYLFARELSPDNRGLSYLALTGSCEIPGGYRGLNLQVLGEALKFVVVEERGRDYVITRFRVTVKRLFSMLQVLGSTLYYSGGPSLGVRMCLEGPFEEAVKAVGEAEERRKKANKRLLAILYRRGFTKVTEHIQYLDSGNVFEGFGTKAVGTFASMISYRGRPVNPNKYIFVSMKVPREVPGWGSLEREFTKFSVRAPKKLRELISVGRMPSVVDLLRRASEPIGGVADGHSVAGSVIVPAGLEGELVERCEEAVKEFLSGGWR